MRSVKSLLILTSVITFYIPVSSQAQSSGSGTPTKTNTPVPSNTPVSSTQSSGSGNAASGTGAQGSTNAGTTQTTNNGSSLQGSGGTTILAGTQDPVNGCLSNTDPKQRKECFELIRHNKDCGSYMTEATKAISQAKADCKQAGGQSLQDCQDIAQECADANNSEADQSNGVNSTMFSALGSQLGVPIPNQPKVVDSDNQIGGRCYNHTDFNSELTRLNDGLKDSRRRLSDVEEKLSSANKDSTDSQSKLMDDAMKAQDDLQQSKKDASSAERDNAVKAMQSQSDALAKIRSLQTQVLSSQAAVVKMIGDRTAALQKLTDGLIHSKCYNDLLTAVRETQALQGVSGNVLTVVTGQTRQSIIGNFQACIASAKAERDATRESTQVQIDAANQDIRNQRAQISDLQEQLSQMSTYQGQAMSEAKQDQQYNQNKAMQALQKINSSMTAEMTNSQQKIMNLNEQLSYSRQDMNDYSNQLATLGTHSAGTKSPTEATASYEMAQSLMDACSRNCDPSDCTDAFKGDKDFTYKGTDGGQSPNISDNNNN